jgi:hypothetical protein
MPQIESSTPSLATYNVDAETEHGIDRTKAGAKYLILRKVLQRCIFMRTSWPQLGGLVTWFETSES